MFDRPIGKNQGIAFPLAEGYAQLRAAGLMIREAAVRIDAGRERTRAAWHLCRQTR